MTAAFDHKKGLVSLYNILKPIKMGNTVVKNRIAFLGMSAHLSTKDHFVTDREIAYFVERAKNGVGWMATSSCSCFPEYPSGSPCIIGLYDDKFIPGIKKLTDAVHEYDSKFIVQLWHPGQAPYFCSPNDVKTCADWTVEELHGIQQRFVECCIRAKAGGADGVEYHIAHNYLCEQMSVPLYNKRTDEYGADTIENAARFNVEALKMIREACGDDFLVGIKINAWDMGLEGGMTIDRCIALCKEFEKCGIDWISVSAGGNLTDELGMAADGSREEGWKIDFAAQVKAATNVPVMATGSIRHLDVMERAIEEGKCDMIGMARGLLAEPEFVKKVEEGREKELRYCLSCRSCQMPSFVPNSKVCSMNPTCKWEINNVDVIKEDGAGRKVMIVGAGPAGANAAIILAKRGFKPVIYDKCGHIGGSIRYACAPDHKHKLAWATEYYQNMFEVLHIPVHLGMEVDEALVKSEEPYAVFVATGSDPVRPSAIPGIFGDNVEMARDVLDGCRIPYANETVVVIGGGMVGMEIATTCKNNGCKATVIEMQDAASIVTAGGPPAQASARHMNEAGVISLYEHKVKEITEHCVIASDKDGKDVEIPATKVIICMGFTPNTKLYDQLKDQYSNVFLIGDANGVDNIAKACNEGYYSALNLK